jgi:hypothetical protein
MIIPAFSTLWHHYPRGESSTVKRLIGGNVNLGWVTNTCVIRVSRALNYSGAAVPGNMPGLSTIRGGDGKRYAYRVNEFQRFLTAHVRPPDVEGDVAGHKGVIMFKVDIWNDATGHFDLWNGSECAHKAYFSEASAVYLWEC